MFKADVIIADGSIVHIREVQEEDAELIREFLSSLSITTLAFRFFSAGINKEELVKYLLKSDGVSLVAIRNGKIIGHASYHAKPQKRAEMSIVIADEFQGKGLGTRLLEILTELANRNGIEIFEAYVRSDNTRMIKVLNDLGFPIEMEIQEEMIKITFPTSLDSKAIETFELRDSIAARNSLKPFFYPRSIAVIGASRDRDSIGGRLFWNIIEGGYKGVVYPVNKNADYVQSIKAYKSILDIEDEIDLAIIAVPAREVIRVAEECAKKEVKALVVISAGFAEIGFEGAKLQEELLDICRTHGMRLLGPNCLGFVNTDPKISLNAQFTPFKPAEGKVGFFSQSGALGIDLLQFTQIVGIGLSSFVSAGNKADISGNDLLCYWEEDERTKVILLYLESFGNPRKFIRIAKRVSKKKPIIVVKGGRTVSGFKAARSHTGALVSSSSVTLDALFEQAGVIRVDTIAEMMDVATLLVTQPLPKGRNVGIITNAGGLGVLLSDYLDNLGLKLAELSEKTKNELRSFLPKEASISNPIDMIASATPEHYYNAVKVVLKDDNVDSLIVIYIPPNLVNPEIIEEMVAKAVEEVNIQKPVLLVIRTPKSLTGLTKRGKVELPKYPFPEQAAKALYHAVKYSEWLKKPIGEEIKIKANKDEVASIIANALKRGETWLSFEEAAKILSAYSIPIAETYFVKNAQEISEMAKRFKDKIVLKVLAKGILHKSDLGFVKIGIDPNEAYDIAKIIEEGLAKQGIVYEGFLLQEMVKGAEMLIGINHDETFGSLVVLGFGGIYAEVFKDFTARLTPLTNEDIEEMLTSLKSYSILLGYRGEKYDIEALKDIIRKVGQLAEDFFEIAELDLNPVIVQQKGAKVVDIKMRIAKVKRPIPVAAKRVYNAF